MNKDELEKIELYAEDKLSAEEKSDMEQRMQNDEHYKAYVNETLLLIKGVKLQGRSELKTKLNQFEQKLVKSSNNKSISVKFWLYAAASVAVVILSVFIYRYIDKPITPHQLYAENFTTYPNVVIPTNREDSLTGQIANAFRLYESRKYDEAIKQFDGLLLERKSDETILFYKAIALMAQNNIDSASSILDSLLINQKLFRQQTLWYLSLCAIYKNDFIKAQKLLLQLQAEFPEYKGTNALLKQINN